MAQDCYKIFKTTYQQGINDGLAVTVATAAAQTAMDNCLKQQSARPSTVAQSITITEGSKSDTGPLIPPHKG